MTLKFIMFNRKYSRGERQSKDLVPTSLSYILHSPSLNLLLCKDDKIHLTPFEGYFKNSKEGPIRNVVTFKIFSMMFTIH